MTRLVKRTAGAAVTDICCDRIEEEIIRAYVRLACAPDPANGLRTVIVAQFGTIEVRMTESMGEESPPLAPPFRIEIFSHEVDGVLGCGEYFEFDEDELRAAVELILSAKVSQPALN